MSKIWIIEPHCDDILFSCPELLMQHEAVCITTFHHSKDRPNTMYEQFGPHIRCLTLPVDEIGSGHAGSFHNNSYLWLQQGHKIKTQLKQYEDVYDHLARNYDTIYIPFGIKHPHHIVLSNFFTFHLWFYNFIYYMDRPYFDVAPENLYARPIEDHIQIVNTPEFDRHKMMTELLDPQFWIGGLKQVVDSRYVPARRDKRT